MQSPSAYHSVMNTTASPDNDDVNMSQPSEMPSTPNRMTFWSIMRKREMIVTHFSSRLIRKPSSTRRSLYAMKTPMSISTTTVYGSPETQKDVYMT